MKVLIIQGSPKMDSGNTALLLNELIKGMNEVNADIELIYTNSLSIQNCKGCFSCMLKTPGYCILNDDMQNIYRRIAESDTLIFASPVYWCGFPSNTRNLIERLSPFLKPEFEVYGDKLGHPWRDNIKLSRIALLSTCGTPELFNFDSMISELKGICAKCGKNGVNTVEFSGAMLRPDAQKLRMLKNSGNDVEDILESLRISGRKLASGEKIPDEILNKISRPLDNLSPEEICDNKNIILKNLSLKNKA
ncbi:MAG: flavodoxin family protein [Spirochaetes bacterium]|nr:flavodoxin family protein [Spirochaetota bacterium]